ncbi:MAG TPA: hypothetical protein VIZ22_01355 [Candidatus Limnocylindrales bacterium]
MRISKALDGSTELGGSHERERCAAAAAGKHPTFHGAGRNRHVGEHGLVDHGRVSERGAGGQRRKECDPKRAQDGQCRDAPQEMRQ